MSREEGLSLSVWQQLLVVGILGEKKIRECGEFQYIFECITTTKYDKNNAQLWKWRNRSDTKNEMKKTKTKNVKKNK